MMMVVRLESIDLPLLIFQMIRVKALSSTWKGLPHRVMLTRLMVEYGVKVGHLELTGTQIGPIRFSDVTARCRMSHRQASLRRATADAPPWLKEQGPTCEKLTRSLVGATHYQLPLADPREDIAPHCRRSRDLHRSCHH